jgi:hypothetical protein
MVIFMRIKSESMISMFSEIRYEPNFKIIDKYGELIELYRKNYNKYSILPNDTELILDQKRNEQTQNIKQIQISPKNFVHSIQLCANHGFFFTSLENEFKKFYEGVELKGVKWIGIRGKHLYNIDEQKNFLKMINNWRGVYFPEKVPFEDQLGKASDFGITTNFKEKDLKGNLTFGFMEKSQSETVFPKLPQSQSQPPEIGLFVDLDIYTESVNQSDVMSALQKHISSVNPIMKKIEKSF